MKVIVWRTFVEGGLSPFKKTCSREMQNFIQPRPVVAQVRGRGRPRDPEKDRLIRDATWKLIARHGYDALTFEAIAQEVGCSRTTLYRRFPTKEALVTTVLEKTLRAVEPVIRDDMTPRDVLIMLVQVGVEYLSGHRGAAILNVASSARSKPELARVFDNHLANVAPYYIAQLRRLAPDADDAKVDFVLHTLMGSFIHHIAIRRVSLSPEQMADLVDQAIGLITKA